LFLVATLSQSAVVEAAEDAEAEAVRISSAKNLMLQLQPLPRPVAASRISFTGFTAVILCEIFVLKEKEK
jgi:hypothetical protein